MSQAIIRSTGTSIAALGSGHSVLGETPAKIPVGGKIRPGIKVLTSKAAAIPKAKELYDAGVASDKTFGQIEREIEQACNIKFPLTPRNVPFFTVHPQDFTVPEIAHAIMQKYGQDGPHGFHLYRFPVIFPIDGWQAVMPHALRAYSRSELRYWSQYGSDGTRYCMTHAPVAVDAKSKRAQRVFGGRAAVPRADNGGICNPTSCREYQNRECNLSGEFVFYVPGIPGSSAIALPTNSFYSMQYAKQKLELVGLIHGGRISGTFDAKPIFYITKKQEEVSMIDPETGKAKKVKQWLIVLEADIDMTRVFQQGEARAALTNGAQAAQLLEGSGVGEDPEEPVEIETTTDAPPVVVVQQMPEDDAKKKTEEAKAAIMGARAAVNTGLGALGIDPLHFSSYGIATWGQGWSGNLEHLKAADELLRKADKEPELLKQIKEWQPEGGQ